MEAEVQRVPAKDVAHAVAADHDQLQTDLFGDALEAGRAHLTRRSDGEPVAGDEEGLAAVDTFTKIGHQIAERSGLPPFVERVQALGDAVGGRGNLIGVDRVELLFLAGDFQVPDDERFAANDRDRWTGVAHHRRRSHRLACDAWLQPGCLASVHRPSIH